MITIREPSLHLHPKTLLPKINSRMADNCIQCQQPVTAKQQGIQCDGCFKWNHRTCNTGKWKLPYCTSFYYSRGSEQPIFARWNRCAAYIFFFAGISQQEYRAAVRAGAEIIWFCPLCPVAESSRISMTESSADILESEEFNPPLRDSFADQLTIYGPQAQPAIEESSEEAMVGLKLF